jgi:hypothetical protein
MGEQIWASHQRGDLEPPDEYLPMLIYNMLDGENGLQQVAGAVLLGGADWHIRAMREIVERSSISILGGFSDSWEQGRYAGDGRLPKNIIGVPSSKRIYIQRAADPNDTSAQSFRKLYPME